MKYRMTYIILFLFVFIFASIAQNSFIDYVYADGTRESSTIGPERMSFQYYYDERSSYRINKIYIDNVFDTLTPMNIGQKESRLRYSDKLNISFYDGEPSGLSGPFMIKGHLDGYGFRSDIIDANNGIMVASFNADKRYAYHNGKQISSIHGSIVYSKFRNIPASILSDELRENLKPFYLAPILLRGTSDVSDASYIKFIFSTLPNELAVARVKYLAPITLTGTSDVSDTSYIEFISPSSSNELAVARVKVINNLKRMGYTLTSPKGVFPLTYQNDKGNTILMYEGYIMVKVKD